MAKGKKIVIEGNKVYLKWNEPYKKLVVDPNDKNKTIEVSDKIEVSRLVGDIFITEGNATFDNPQDDQKERKIIVVGIRYKTSMIVLEKIGINPPIRNKKYFEFESPKKHTVLKLGYSITHPNDKYDYNFGVNFAIKRALKSHRSLIATSYSMLAQERFENIVKDELEYIQTNLVDYVQ